MIAAEVTGSEIVVSGPVAAGTVAHIDAEWLPAAGAAPVPAILARDGSLEWWGSDDERVALAGTDAGAAIASLASRAASRVPAAARAVEVLGGGEIARLVAELLGARAAAAPGTPPDAIVDTTGDPERIVAATARLQDLGTLVLAGETRPLDLDVYVDVHSRGLVVHGVPMLPPGDRADDVAARPGPPARAAADGGGRARLAPGSPWYAVELGA